MITTNVQAIENSFEEGDEFHYKGSPYILKSFGQVKYEGSWQDCVVYCSAHDESRVYVRSTYEFFSKFNHIP